MGIFEWFLVTCAALFVLCILACIVLIPVVLLSGGFVALLALFRKPMETPPA